MSSLYGPELLKDPTFADDVNTAVGRKKVEEFETDHDRAKRIRRERKAQVVKDKEATQKQQMNQAIGAVLRSSSSTQSATPQFKTFAGPAAGPARGPSVPGPASGSAPGPESGPESGPAPGPATGPAPGPPPEPVSGPPVPAGSTGPSCPGPDAAVEPVLGAASVNDDAGSAPAARPRGPMRPEAEADSAAAPAEEVILARPQQLAPMDFLNKQKRVSWDQLKDNLANAQFKEEGVPGAKGFDDYSAKLEKTRHDRLKQQEADTKKLLKAVNKNKGGLKKKDKKKDKKSKGVKRTADGAVLAGSSDESSAEDDDCLVARYKKP